MANLKLWLAVLYTLLLSSQISFCGSRYKRDTVDGVTEASSTPDTDADTMKETSEGTDEDVKAVLDSIASMGDNLNLKTNDETILGTKDNEQGEEEVVETNEISMESIEMLGEDSMEALTRCYKCNKPSYKFKKDLFCLRCSQAGLLVVNENMEQVNCKKCRKYKYRSKNWEYCEDTCPEAMDKPLFPAQQELVPEHMKKVPGIGVTSTTLAPSTTTTAETTTTLDTTTTTTAVEITTQPLSLMGSILRFLVVANTYDDRPKPDLPQAIVN